VAAPRCGVLPPLRRRSRPALTYGDEPLAQHAVTFARDRRQLRTVREERLCVTPFQSPQVPLLPLANRVPIFPGIDLSRSRLAQVTRVYIERFVAAIAEQKGAQWLLCEPGAGAMGVRIDGQ
jgi:hypothetical protein